MFKNIGLLIYTEEIGDYWSDILTGSGLDLIGIHPVGGPVAAKSLDRLLEEVKTARFKEFAEKLMNRGFTLEYEFHALSWLVQRDLLKTKPEWFRMDKKGERVNDFNICASNKDALAYLESRSTELAKKLPYTGNKYFFWIDDVKKASCHCDDCRNLSPSDQALILHNHMLRGLKRHNPDAKTCYLAYQDTIKVPENIIPDEGIFLEYAPIDRTSNTPIDDPSSAENKKEASNIDSLLDFFGKKDSRVLEYWIDNSRFCNWKKPLKKLELNAEVMQKDVRFYMKKGFESATGFACFLGEDYAEQFGEPPIREYAEILAEKNHFREK